MYPLRTGEQELERRHRVGIAGSGSDEIKARASKMTRQEFQREPVRCTLRLWALENPISSPVSSKLLFSHYFGSKTSDLVPNLHFVTLVKL